MADGRQEQRAGDASTNVQAGGDVTIHSGLSVAEVRDVALDVFRSNFLELRGVAKDVARGRAETLVEDYLDELQRLAPGRLKSADDPDMQNTLYEATRAYACSGEDDLERALVDLLVDRSGEEGRTIRTLVLNEAIKSAPKLTENQRRAIAVAFYVRHTRILGPVELDDYFEVNIKQNLVPLIEGLPRTNAAYQHIEYVGAGAVGIGSLDIGGAFAQSGRRWFTHGVGREEVPPVLQPFLDDARVFIPCLRDASRVQVNVMSDDDIDNIVASLGDSELKEPLLNVAAMGVMSANEVIADMSERVPQTAELIDTWQNTLLKNTTLTSVGIAIGHGYWRRVTGNTTPLSIWISD